MNAPIPAKVLDNAYVLRAMHDGVATLTLNRGDRLNPLSSALIGALSAELKAVAADSSVRVVVIAGAGRGFPSCRGRRRSRGQCRR